MKIFKKLISVITATSLMAALLLVPNTSIAAGESREDAQEITIGEKVKDEVTAKTSVWYKFTPTKSGNPWYRLGAICKSGYYYVRLYNEDSSEIIWFSQYDNLDGLKYIKLEPQKEYYIKVEFSAASAYTLFIDEIKDNAPETDEGAINLLSGIKYTGNFECVTDTDYFTFTAGATKSTVNMTLKFSSNYSYFAIFNEDGAELKKMSVDSNGTGSLTIDTVKGEKYYISTYVGSVSNNSRASGQYAITVKSGSTDIKNLTVDDILNKAKDVYIFNGKVRLIKDTDYTLTIGTVKAGKAAVTIKGKGNYTGTIVKQFVAIN